MTRKNNVSHTGVGTWFSRTPITTTLAHGGSHNYMVRQVAWVDVLQDWGILKVWAKWFGHYAKNVAVTVKEFLLMRSRTFYVAGDSTAMRYELQPKFSITKKTPKRPVKKNAYPYCVCHVPGRADWTHGRKRCRKK